MPLIKEELEQMHLTSRLQLCGNELVAQPFYSVVRQHEQSWDYQRLMVSEEMLTAQAGKVPN